MPPTTDTGASTSGKAGTSTKLATNELTVQKFNQTSTSISGTAEGLRVSLKELEADLKKDIAGQKEYQTYLKTQNIRKAELQKKIDDNNAWIANFEANKDNGAFEAQYKKLLSDIQEIYGTAKEFHGKGIDLLIKEFDYHLAFKRWSDTFTAVPFKPQ